MTCELKPFDTIRYQTSNGENCEATKNKGIVTVRGDQNGVRQVPLDNFMKDFVQDQSKKSLERVPERDSVSFSGSAEKPKKKGKGLLYSSLGAWIATNVSYFLFNKNVDKEIAKWDAEFKAKGATVELQKALDSLEMKNIKGGKIFNSLGIIFGIATAVSFVNYIVKNKKQKQ